MSRPPSAYPKIILMIQNLVTAAKEAPTPEERNDLLDKAHKRLQLLNERLERVSVERGRKGGTKTAERGPDYFRQIAAMRKTRAGGRPRKQE